MNWTNNLANFRPYFRKFDPQRNPPGSKLLKSGRLKLAKPQRPTVLSATTARRLKYLQDHGLANFAGSRFVVASTHFINKLGERVRLPKGLIHGGV